MEDQEKGKAGRPRKVPFEQDPRVAAAVQKGIADGIAQMMSTFMSKGIMPPPQALADDGTVAPDTGSTKLMRELAMSIAEVADQGTNRKRVAPEVLASRETARKECEFLVSEAFDNYRAAKAAGDQIAMDAWMPQYRVASKIYFNERLVEPYRVDPATKAPVANEITWTGIPNGALIPLNEVAKKIMAAYNASIGFAGINPRADNRPVWVTQGGMVVKGDAAAQKRFVATPEPFTDQMEVKAPAQDPNAEFVHVLGSIAPPARQAVGTGAR